MGELSSNCLGTSELPRPAPSMFSQTTLGLEWRACLRPVQLWPPDPDSSLHKGEQGQTQVEPPPATGLSAKSSRPPQSGYDEREPQREKCLKIVGVAA